MNTDRLHPIAFLIGRFLIGGMFLYSGLSNLLDLQGTLGYAGSKGVTGILSFVLIASLLLILAGLSFVTGILPKLGVVAAVLFLVPVTLIMHNFWTLDGFARAAELHYFLGNIGLIGSALMFLVVEEPWHYSLHDRFYALVRGQSQARQAISTK